MVSRTVETENIPDMDHIFSDSHGCDGCRILSVPVCMFKKRSIFAFGLVFAFDCLGGSEKQKNTKSVVVVVACSTDSYSGTGMSGISGILDKHGDQCGSRDDL